MAEPTEAEQQKQTKALEGIEKKEAQVVGDLGKISSILKETNAIAVLQHDESEAGKEEFQKLSQKILETQSKDLRSQTKLAEDKAKMEKVREGKDEKKKSEKKDTDDKTDKKSDKANKEQKSWFERSGNWFDGLKKDADDEKFFEKQKFKFEGGYFTRHLKALGAIKTQGAEKTKHDAFMKKMAKESNWFQRTSYNMSVRAAKLALRGGKAIKDWGVKGLTNMKDKAFDWIKSLGKLLALLGIWGAALWMDANMLKEDWEALKEKLTAWKDKLVGWWDELDTVLDNCIYWFNEIKDWFDNVFGEELGGWMMALAAFGLWIAGPKLAFMLTMGIAKSGLWAAKKILQKLGILPKDLPDPKAVDADAKGAKKKVKAKASWWKRMFGIADDATKGIPKLDAKWGQNSAKNLKSTGAFWNKHIPNIHQYSDDVGKLGKTIGDNPNMKKGFFARMGERFTKMFNTVGGWANTMGSKVGGWFGDAKKSVGGWFKDSWSKAKDLGKSIVDKGKKAFDATIDAAKTLGKGVVDKSKKILTGGVDLLKGAGNMLNKVPGVKQAIGLLGGTAKLFAKLAVPFEAARGSWAGFASTGEDDERNVNQRMDDASAGMVKSVVDFVAIDLVDLGGMLENVIRTDLKEGEEGWLSGVADSMGNWSDETFGKWAEGTKLLDGGDPTALRLEIPEAVKKRRAAIRQRAEFLAMTKKMGLTEEGEEGTGRGGLTKVKTLTFDKEGFQRMLLSASKDKSFTMMTQMIAGLSKVGKISAEEAERYKMDISKEQAAGTPPIIITNNNSTSNKGSTTMIAASNANNPMNQVLRDW